MCTGKQIVTNYDAKLNIIARYEKYCIESGRNVNKLPDYQSREARGVVLRVANQEMTIAGGNRTIIYIPTRCSSQISSTATSAGLTPEIRPAWPMDMGRMASSFSRASSRRPPMVL